MDFWGFLKTKAFQKRILWTALTTAFPLCLCVCDCAQASSGPQQWLCCVGLVGWGSWWLAPGCGEEVEELLLQTSQSEEQELLLMESPSLSSWPLLVLLSLHIQRFRSIFAYSFTGQPLHWLWGFLCNACPLSLFPFPGFLCFVGFCTSNFFYFTLLYLLF